MNTRSLGDTPEALACLIIDDPLIRPQYGCLDYEKLLLEMKDHNFFTEIAFIPWNYNRSNPKTVRLFADNIDYFAICVHGCNHTGNEFGSGNYEELSCLSSTALWRMEQHKRLTGLSYDPVMVFPHGLFSSVAMEALKNRNFFAAFNSNICATDAEQPPAIEYERPFTRSYHDFPLFLRRYPKDKYGFVEDLAHGRPLIIAEHHSAFRNGYKEITALVDWVNSLGDIKWASLLDIATHYLGVRTEDVECICTESPSHLGLNARAVCRRILSEARDNYVETNDVLRKAYKMLRG